MPELRRLVARTDGARDELWAAVSKASRAGLLAVEHGTVVLDPDRLSETKP